MISLKDFLFNAGYFPRISEDLDTRKGNDRKIKDPEVDRELSERLIAESDIHLFVLVRERKNEPDNLIQSVSMRSNGCIRWIPVDRNLHYGVPPGAVVFIAVER